MATEFDSLVVIGFDRVKAQTKLELFEKFAITNDEVHPLLSSLREQELLSDGVVLSTCNRIDIYCVSSKPEQIQSQLIARSGVADDLSTNFEILHGRAAFLHACFVACGIKAANYGEPEIFGQMKKALEIAKRDGFVGKELDRFFQQAFTAAKKVRTQTDIGAGTVSIPGICANFSRRIFGELANCHVLCVGAGTTIETVLNYLAEHTKNITIANRTRSRAEDIAAPHNAHVIDYHEVTEVVADFDIIITATSSKVQIISKGTLEEAFVKRKRKPMAIFDLAIPRNVEDSASKLEDLYLYTFDELADLSTINLEKRRSHEQLATTYFATEADNLFDWYARQHNSVAVIKQLLSRSEQIQQQLLDQALSELNNGKTNEEVMTRLAKRLTDKLTHDPLDCLHQHHANPELVKELSTWYQNERTHNPKDQN